MGVVRRNDWADAIAAAAEHKRNTKAKEFVLSTVRPARLGPIAWPIAKNRVLNPKATGAILGP